jgi:aspartate racemase
MMKRLGILGGMGPLASAELLGTIYRLNAVETEQAAPDCVVLSDPSFPDRTSCILAGDTRELTARLVASLEDLVRLGAERIVIACVTIHHVLPQVPAPLRHRVISLIDLVIDELLAYRRPVLLLATSGARAARIFESHERWPSVAEWVAFPDEADQRDLHDWIYRLKGNGSLGDCWAWLASLIARSGREGAIFGCTELHLLHRSPAGAASELGVKIIDPLLIVARELPRLLGGPGHLSRFSPGWTPVALPGEQDCDEEIQTHEAGQP